MNTRALRGVMMALGLAAVSPQAPAAPRDAAPLPPSMVERIVSRAVGDPRLPRPPASDEVLTRHLDSLEQNLRAQERRSQRAAAGRTAAMLAAGARGELVGLRERLQRAGVSTVAQARLDGVLNDLDTFERGSSAERAKARTRLQRALRAARADSERGRRLAGPARPMLTHTRPPKSVKLPAVSTPPAYMAARQLERAPPMYAFNGNLLLLAAAPTTPAEASSCDYAAEDLADDGQDVQLTPLIRAKAEELGHAPARLFEFVANAIVFEPYWGALKGATGTLATGSGNATDQASLLIALLRASNIPARYVRGRVSFQDASPLGADSRLNRWLRVKDYPAAVARLGRGGAPEAGSVVNASSQKIGAYWSHVWVEACVAYAHYRGTRLDNAGHRWIPLDPSFETRRYRAQATVSGAFNFDAYLGGLSQDLPHERFEDQAQTELAGAGLALNEAGYSSQRQPLTVDILPASLPYEIDAFTAWAGTTSAETARLPDGHRYLLDLKLSRTAGELLPQQALAVSDFLLGRLTLGYEGATAADRDALTAWRANPDPGASAPCRINVVPVLRGEGAALVTGSIAVGVCSTDSDPHTLGLKVRLPELGQPVVTGCGPTGADFCAFPGLQAADLYAVSLYGWQTTKALITARVAALAERVNTAGSLSGDIEATVGEYLHVVGQKYLRYFADAARRIGRLSGETGDVGLSFGLVSTTSKVERVLDEPLGIVRRGMVVDFPAGRSRSVGLTSGQSDFQRFKLFGHAASALESYVWQENARLDAVSTVRGLQFGNANPTQTGMLTLTSGTGTGGLVTTGTDPAYGYATSFIASLQTNYLTPGYEVKIPKRQLQYNDWKGYVFAATRNQSGTYSGTFAIAGGYAGGYTTGTPTSFVFNPVAGTGYQGTGTASGAAATVPSFISNGAVGGGSSPYNSLAGDPVNLVTGGLYHAERDLVIPARDLPFVFERTYNSLDIPATPGPLGHGWRHSFEHQLRFLDERADGVTDGLDSDGLTSTLEWFDGSGARRRMGVTGTAAGVPTGAAIIRPAGFFFTTAKTAAGYQIQEKNGLIYSFENVAGTVGQVAKLTKITSRNGNTLTLAYASGKLSTVSDDNARALTFTYSGERLTRVQDFTGRRHEYAYVADQLRTYRNPLALAGTQPAVTYEYFTSADGPRLAHALKRYTLPRGNGMAFEYYVNGRVLRHTSDAGEQYSFRYDDMRRETVVTDPRGAERSLRFDPYGNPVRVTEEDGAVWTYAYADPADAHLRTRVTDPYGQVTQSAYDASGNLTQVTNPSGSTVVYSHYAAHTFGQPGKAKDARGNYRLLKYDAAGNLTEAIALKEGLGAALDPATYTANAGDVLAVTRHTYDAGNRTATTRVRDVLNNRGLTLTWAYSAQKLYPTQLTRCGDKDGDGLVSDDACDVAPLAYDAVGRLTGGVDARFEAVAFSYDAVDRIVRGTDALGQVRDYRFDANGNRLGESLTVGGRRLDALAFEYDASDRRVTALDAGGGVTRYTYDPQGNLTNVLDPDGFTLGFEYDAKGRVSGAVDKEGRQATRTLDGLGRELKRTDPNGNTTTYEYYAAAQDGRLKKTCDAEARCTTFEYDAAGNVTRVIDNLNQDTLTQYDAQNRPLRIAQPGYVDTVLGTVRPITCYSYDLLGNLKDVKAGHSANVNNTCTADAATLSLQASHGYDDRGNRLSTTDALSRTTTVQYDLHDNPTQVTAARGNRVQHDYGYGGQLLATRSYAPPGTVLEATETYTRNSLGQVTAVTGPNVNYSYAYDAAHRLASVTDSRANQSLQYHWSSGGLLDRTTGPQSETTDYQYDPVGRLRHVIAPNHTLIGFQYDAGGRVIEQTLPGGVTTRSSYFKDNALKTHKTSRGATTLLNLAYTQDSLGRRATLTETLSGLPTRTQTYGYDPLSRLTSVQEGATTQTLTYDPFGNRRTFNDGATTRFYAHDAAHQLDTVRTGSAAGPIELDLAYDANGNTRTRDAGGSANDWTYAYDAQDRLAQASKPGTTESYLYDDQGRRIARTSNGTRTDYLYDGLAIYLEVNGSWTTPSARLTHGAGFDQPLLRATAGQTQAYTRDGTNSAVLTTDAVTGSVIATQRFDAWGNKTAGAGSVPLYGYAGGEADAATGLTFLRARYYDPGIGRFTQADSLGFIEGVNRYAYARNDPVNRADPLGTLSQAFAGTQSSYGAGGPGAIDSARQGLSDTLVQAGTQLALGILPGYDLVQAWRNPDAGFIDYAAGVLGIAPGLGKGLGLALKVTDRALDAAKVARGAEGAAAAAKGTLKGAQNPKVAEAAARGRQMHKDYDYGPGFEKEVALPSGKRADAVNWETREVVELKPNNPNAVRRGERQVEGYRRELESVTGECWTCRVETYD